MQHDINSDTGTSVQKVRDKIIQNKQGEVRGVLLNYYHLTPPPLTLQLLAFLVLILALTIHQNRFSFHRFPGEEQKHITKISPLLHSSHIVFQEPINNNEAFKCSVPSAPCSISCRIFHPRSSDLYLPPAPIALNCSTSNERY
jgi:hypothetical protein